MLKIIHGDYQTPAGLAQEVTAVVTDLLRFEPRRVVEPTCGEGAFVIAGAHAFPRAQIAGFELAVEKVERLQASGRLPVNAQVRAADFYAVPWAQQLQPDRCLVLGNPPWVASARLGELGADNRPRTRLNLGHAGLANKTGASNYDIAEFMALALSEVLALQQDAALALLVKATTARRLAGYLQAIKPTDVRFFRIDGRKHFGVSVPCGLLFVDFRVAGSEPRYREHAGLDPHAPARVLALRGRQLAAVCADAQAFVTGQRFRSGVKHDAADVLELAGEAPYFRNKLGADVFLPAAAVFPLVKSAGLGKDAGRALVLPPSGLTGYPQADTVPQETVRAYLAQHHQVFERRKSAVYAKQVEFAVFGVGPYSFKPWKVAISAFAKTPDFHLVGPRDGRPVLFDDTVYFLAFDTREEAGAVREQLMAARAQAALKARMFPEDMRPVKAKVLNELFCCAEASG